MFFPRFENICFVFFFPYSWIERLFYRLSFVKKQFDFIEFLVRHLFTLIIHLILCCMSLFFACAARIKWFIITFCFLLLNALFSKSMIRTIFNAYSKNGKFLKTSRREREREKLEKELNFESKQKGVERRRERNIIVNSEKNENRANREHHKKLTILLMMKRNIVTLWNNRHMHNVRE